MQVLGLNWQGHASGLEDVSGSLTWALDLSLQPDIHQRKQRTTQTTSQKCGDASSKTLRREVAQGSVGSEPLGVDPTPIPKPGRAAAGVPPRGISDRSGQGSAWLHVSTAPEMFQATVVYEESKACHLVIPIGLSPKTLGFPACLTFKTHICPEFQVRGVNPVPPGTGGCPCPG